MKKTITIFSLITLFLISSAIAFSGSGSGTQGSPYIITTPSQLNEMRDDVTASYALGNDIDMTGFGNWVPVGNWTTYFEGTFDGNGYTISNLDIAVVELGQYPWGLFGAILTSDYIRNFNLVNLSMTEGGPISTECCVGGIVGGMDDVVASFENIHITGTINLPNVEYVGGFFGYAGGGGVMTMQNLSFVGDITGKYNVGGIGGDCWDFIMTNTYTAGTITASVVSGSGPTIGGLCGTMGGSVFVKPTNIVNQSYSTMTISVDGNSVAVGTSSGLGGIAGRAQQVPLEIHESYQNGAISLVNAAGLWSIDHIIGSNATGAPIGTTNVYYNNEIDAYSTTTTATALTTAQSTQEASYVGYDFVSTWAINEGVASPVFIWNYVAPPVTPPSTPTGEVTAAINTTVNNFGLLLGVAILVFALMSSGFMKGVEISGVSAQAWMIRILAVVGLIIVVVGVLQVII